MSKKIVMYEPMGNLDLGVHEFLNNKDVLYFVVDEEAPVPESNHIEKLIFQQRGYEFEDVCEVFDDNDLDDSISTEQYKHGFMDWYISRGYDIEYVPVGGMVSPL